MVADTITVVGMGLIGGSYGLAIRERSLARQVIGVSRRESTLRQALERGACNSATTELIAGSRDSDLIILCAPVSQIPVHAAQLAAHLKDGAIVTDAGSTKGEIVMRCEEALHPRAAFIGGHPMAGSEKSGVQFARVDLFEGSTYVLTPTANTASRARERVGALAEALGARVCEIDPAVHDCCVGLTSHLPHCLAFALTHAVARGGPEVALLSRLAAGSFHDASRVAKSSPELWADILLTNRESILPALDRFVERLAEVRQLLESGDGSSLQDFIGEANRLRASLTGGHE